MVVRWWLWSQLVDLWAVVGFVFWSEIEWERGKKKRQRREKSQEWLTFSKPFRTKFWSELKAITSVDANLPSILYQKSYFFFYFTYSFLQNTRINLSILHIYLIKYSSFYHFLLFSLSPFFSHRLNLKFWKHRNPNPSPSEQLSLSQTQTTTTQTLRF